MLSVLIVDDDAATVDVIRDTVDWDGLGVSHVLEAYSVDQAKRLLGESAVDIVISDIEMPGASGLDLLEWIRAQDRQEQFLFLTCHENFSYAAQAIRNNAVDYLLKPFDPEIVETAVRRAIEKIAERRQMLADEQWLRENRRRLQLSFWVDLFRGRFEGMPDRLWTAFSQQTTLDRDAEYYLVVGRVTNLETDTERYGRKLYCYALENIHSELLCGTTENANVVCVDEKRAMTVSAVCRAASPEEMERRCVALREAFSHAMSSELTCCICGPARVDGLYELREAALDLIRWNVSKYGTVFWEKELEKTQSESTAVLDAARLADDLAENRKRDFLEYLRGQLQEAQAENRLSEGFLFEMRHEILQAVYVDLARSGINAGQVQAGEVMRELSERSTQSSLDMLRWATSVVNVAIERKRELSEGESLAKRVDQYIEENYQLDLNRDRIAEAFFLSPGYLGKLYKKETGKNIKDQLAECRVRHAKQQLANPRLRINEIALDVGFENITYFSTVFKKLTGISPYEYRKSILGEGEPEGTK